MQIENILVDDGDDLRSIKIADFGLSGQFGCVPMLSGQCGTLIYMAPELFSSRIYSKPVDIWSCGMILYMICSGGRHPLYRSDDTVETYKQKLNKLEWHFRDDFNQQAKHLFLKCVCLEPSERYVAHQILEHPWITGKQDAQTPLTFIEMIQSFTLREKFHSIVKATIFLNYLAAN